MNRRRRAFFRHDEDCDCLACMQRRCIETLTERTKEQTEELHRLRHEVILLGDPLRWWHGGKGENNMPSGSGHPRPTSPPDGILKQQQRKRRTGK